MATEVLENQLDEAEEAARQLETRRSAFLAAQAKVEVPLLLIFDFKL